MLNPDLVAYSIIAGLSFMVVLDVIVGTNRNKDDDITVLLNKLSNGKLFFIPFAWGVVTAHLYFGSKHLMFSTYDISNSNGLYGALGLIVILIVIGQLVKLKPNKYRMIGLLFSGLCYGHFFWTMHGVP